MRKELTGLGALERLGKQFELLELEDAAARRPRHLTLAIAAAIVLALAAASLTPPGRAVAGKIGELVGIGDEPTGLPPSDHGDSVVIGLGESPSGAGFEIYATSVLASRGDETPIICIGLNVPETEGPPGSGSCLTDENKRHLAHQAVLPIAIPGTLGGFGEATKDAFVVQGLARAEVSAVELEYALGGRIQEVPVDLFSLDEELGTEIGTHEKGKFFIGMLPGFIVQPTGDGAEIEEAFSRVRIRALDSRGEPLLDERYTDLPLPSWWAAVLEAVPPGASRQAPPPAAIREDANPGN